MPVSDTSYAYAYAVGRVRALETRLIDKSKLNRMIEAPSPDEVLKILAETDYATAVAGLNSYHDFETVLTDELGRTFTELQKMSPRPEIIAMLMLRFDVHNLKVLFKAKYLEIEPELLLPMGASPLSKLQDGVTGLDFREFSPRLRSAAEQIAEEFALTRDSQVIDLILDRFLFTELIQSSREARSSFLEGFFQKQIDLTNIKTFIRVQRMGRDREFLKKVLLPHGRLTPDLFTRFLGEPLESLARELAMSEYGPLVEEGVREWLDRESLVRLEKLADDFITASLQCGKQNPFGLEALIGYLWAKEIETINIRLIMVGKINKLPEEAIRERIRHVYL